MVELKCHCNTVIGMTEDEDEMLVPVYRYCKIHKNEDRSPFLAKDLDRLHGVRLNRAGMDFWRELKAEQEIERQAAENKPNGGVNDGTKSNSETYQKKRSC